MPEVTDQPPAPSAGGNPLIGDGSTGTPLIRGEVAFRLLVEAVQDYAIFLIGADGRILTWNLGAQRIKGYTAEEAIGQHISMFYVPEEREADRPTMLLGMAAEQGRYEDVGWRVRKDGTRFFADVLITALRDEDGRTYAFAKVTRDITERLAAEERTRQLLVEREARLAAENALQARDRFLAIASHELRTPVASLQLAMEALLRARSLGTLDDTRLTTSLARLKAATARLGQLVDELLDISRLREDRVAFNFAPTDLTALAREIMSGFVDAGAGGRLRLDAPGPVTIPVDAGRLEQVITNIVDNALKYSEPPSPVVVRVEPAEGGALLSVTDAGIGLDEEADRIFEAFGRGANAEHIQGIGLGLFISRQIVERHGGRISGSTLPTGGAAFTVWLPENPGEVANDPR